jgi:hypothetical protein
MSRKTNRRPAKTQRVQTPRATGTPPSRRWLVGAAAAAGLLQPGSGDISVLWWIEPAASQVDSRSSASLTAKARTQPAPRLVREIDRSASGADHRRPPSLRRQLWNLGRL